MLSAIGNLFFGRNKIQTKNVQDILGFDDIDGNMIIINKNEFRMVLEIGKVNMKSRDEKNVKEIIETFKQTINLLKFPVQWERTTRVFDLHNYLLNLTDETKDIVNPVRLELLDIYKKFLGDQVETQKMTSSQTHLIIGFRVGQMQTEINRSISFFIKSMIFPKKNIYATMSYDEKIIEVSDIFKRIEANLKSSLRKIGSNCRRLEDDELHVVLYQSLRREMAIIQRWGNIPENGIPMRVSEVDDQEISSSV
ncbi:MAG: hypothetical protein JWM44_2106 [Bacilli bacterium]|nr:hypothetical protein [Bacilli bacterium]